MCLKIVRFGSVILSIIQFFSTCELLSWAFTQAFCHNTLLIQHLAEYNYILLGILSSLHNLVSMKDYSGV